MPCASRRFLGLVLSACVLSAPWLIGCQRQAEGERCSLLNMDADCRDNLVCTDASGLRADDGVDRCCPEVGSPISDQRCSPRRTGGDGDGDGMGGIGGASGDGDDTLKGFGEGCDYTSDCVLGLVCGPQGECQFECNRDRDCDAGKVCSSEQQCVTAS